MNILLVFPKICSIEVFNIMNSQYNEQISPVPWHFIKLRFTVDTIHFTENFFKQHKISQQKGMDSPGPLGQLLNQERTSTYFSKGLL